MNANPTGARTAPPPLRTLGLLLALALLPTLAAAQQRPAEDEVAVGYGVQSVKHLTGSVGSLVVRRTDRVPATVEEMLLGRIPGVEVLRLAGGGFSVRIRGARSFLGSSEPLYVVDGIPVMGALGPGSALVGINPHDVERIDVLKDAGSTAIYGMRGANGVIVVTTRRAEP